MINFARVLLLAACAVSVSAQDLTVYTDALQNGFLDYSYGGGADFLSTAQVRSGTYSIAFTGNNYNAVSFARPGQAVSTATYPTLTFWVHGGATGNQQLRIFLQLNDAVVASGELDTYISGGTVSANTWRQVTVTFANAPLAYAGSFDRIDLQSDVNGTQQVLYLDDVTLNGPAAQPSASLQIEHDVTVGQMVSDRFTWRDGNNEPRVAVLAHNTGQTGPGGTRGGELREFRYQVDGGTRVVAASGSGPSGFGYVVSHPQDGLPCLGGFDSSSLGHLTTGTFTRVFEGTHHAIFRFTQNYPRYCQTGATAPAAAINLPVTIDWVFSTGRDHPLWAVTYDMSSIAVNTLKDDSRAPYGELLFDGAASEFAHSQIAGVGWGDRYKFTTTSTPLKFSSSWTWNTANTIPYVKLWTTAVDATMGTVQTQPIAQQDAGGYWGVSRWNTDSGAGNACADYAYLMPCDYNWPYQSVNYSLAGTNPTINTRLAWGTNFGFLGQSQYLIHGSADYGGELPNTYAPGWPRKSYSTFIVFGKHTTGTVETQVGQIEALQTVTLSATTGSVATTGPGGAGRSDTVTYSPPGYDHVYAALTFVASANQLDANIAVGTGTLTRPLVIVRSFTGSAPTVKLAGATLVSGTDYFASLRPAASELWITLNRSLAGATNHLEVIPAGGVPAAPTGLAATMFSTTRVDLTWNASAGASSYQVDRKVAGGDFVQIATPPGAAYSDIGLAAGAAYLYRVRAVNGSGASANSAPDLATTIVFTDPALPGVGIKAVHLSQLRTAIDAVRALVAGLGAAPFTDAPNPGLGVKAVHISEARTFLDAARGPLGLSTGGYTDGALAGIAVKAVHWQELRDRTQ